MTKQKSKGVLQIEAPKDQTRPQTLSKAALLPTLNAVTVIQAYQGNILGKDTDLQAMVEALRDDVKDVQGGDLSRLEAMLLSQATALQTMFTSLARRAANQEQLKHYGVFMGLALKAQAQSRATISALVDLKFPRQATFVKQANIAHGPQQVNNGPSSELPDTNARAREEEMKPDQTELLEAPNGSTNLDRGTTAEATRGNPAVETVDSVDRPKVTRRKGQSLAQR